LFFLYRAKKLKKYTIVFDRFRALKAINRAPKQSIDRSEARFHSYLPDFCPKCKKKPLLPRQTKEVSLMVREAGLEPARPE
jgi:hypothetical protein